MIANRPMIFHPFIASSDDFLPPGISALIELGIAVCAIGAGAFKYFTHRNPTRDDATVRSNFDANAALDAQFQRSQIKYEERISKMEDWMKASAMDRENLRIELGKINRATDILKDRFREFKKWTRMVLIECGWSREKIDAAFLEQRSIDE